MSDTIKEVTKLTRVTGNLTFDQPLKQLDVYSLRSQMSGLYNVSLTAIKLTQADNNVVSYRITSADEGLSSRIHRASSQMAKQLGVNATHSVISDGQIDVTTTRFVQSSCPAGSWCSAGNAIPCVKDTFNALPNAYDQSFCLPCPANSVTQQEGSARFEDCVCAQGYFADTRLLPIINSLRAAGQIKSEAFRLNASRFCHSCVSGVACRPGTPEAVQIKITLETLPLLPGYWRSSPHSLDIRSCGDRTPGTTPGCKGGVGEPCKDWLAGPLCTLCNVTAGRFYDKDLFECNECIGGSVALPLGVVAALLGSLALVPALCLGLRLPQRIGLVWLWRRLRPTILALGLKPKGAKLSHPSTLSFGT